MPRIKKENTPKAPSTRGKLPYNRTQLTPSEQFERHVYHRDQFAHFFRWTYILNTMTGDDRILDVGCGTGELFEVLYRNRHQPKTYLGVDIRGKTLTTAMERWGGRGDDNNVVAFLPVDACEQLPFKDWCEGGLDWTAIALLEVLEHVGKERVPALLDNVVKAMSPDTWLYVSTPNFNGESYAANHVVEGEVAELTHEETEAALLNAGLEIVKRFGTFASWKDVEPVLTPEERAYWDGPAGEYWDSNFKSNIAAVSHPRESRNCLWICRTQRDGTTPGDVPFSP
jgi:2-polyprenyl-3-methyl-5-hydroxy-6-metoxy-1,4-benzoquinol methylase